MKELQRNRSASLSPAAGGRVSKKARSPDCREAREGCCSAGFDTVLERIERLIVETKADMLELTEVMKELVCELRKRD